MTMVQELLSQISLPRMVEIQQITILGEPMGMQFDAKDNLIL